MTYCVGLLVDTGLVMLSDSRTNAGVDQINTFRKMQTFQHPHERALVLMSAGNLGITQAVVNLLETPNELGEPTPLMAASNMFNAARVVGDALRSIYQRDALDLKEHGYDFNGNFILGGQIKGEEPRLFHIYSAGNFIEASIETPYFQIGESKYGKPIIDRVITRSSSLAQAAKCALVSMDSTMRSNLSVGPPLDLAIIKRDELRVASHISIDENNEYFKMIHAMWGFALQEVFSELPNPNW
ncbi:MAG: putative proteasome-type protease [Gammaproteobacteria bacterium]|jgi:putative proteasome-type protease|nr:peptidase [Gammaproteobacteria bacterium]MEA3140520.1 putative proteasome-type protease [Gammaproteobacteria bacterium]